MKNLTKITVFMLATSMTIIGCQKDENMTPGNSSSGDSFKSTTNNIKSGSSITGADIIEYDSLLQIEEEPATLDRDLALLMLESSINLNKGNHGMISTSSEFVEFEIEIYSEDLGNGYHEVTGADALSYYDDLVSGVETAYEDSDLYDEYNTDAFISIVDIAFETNISGAGLQTSTTIGVLIKHRITLLPEVCSATSSWKALDQLGPCSGSGVNWDAAMRLESFLTNLQCSTLLWDPSGCGTRGVYDVVISNKNGFGESTIWDGTAPSNCITAGAINGTYFPGALTEMQNMRNLLPAHPWKGTPGYYRDPIDYSVRKAEHSTTSDVAHDLYVTYAFTWCGPVDPI